MNSDVNFSFYACSPIPTNPSLSSNNATVTYEVTGNKDILWGEAIAEDVDSADGKLTPAIMPVISVKEG